MPTPEDGLVHPQAPVEHSSAGVEAGWAEQQEGLTEEEEEEEEEEVWLRASLEEEVVDLEHWQEEGSQVQALPQQELASASALALTGVLEEQPQDIFNLDLDLVLDLN